MWNQVSYDPRSYKRNLCNCVYRSLEIVRTLTGFEPLTLWQQCDALTNWAMKLLTSGTPHLWFLTSLGGMNFEVTYEIFHILNSWCEIKEAMILAVMNVIYAIAYTEACKKSGLWGVWTCDPATAVQCSNQLSYEAADMGSWSFGGPKEPTRNDCEVT